MATATTPRKRPKTTSQGEFLQQL